MGMDHRVTLYHAPNSCSKSGARPNDSQVLDMRAGDAALPQIRAAG